MNLPSAAALPNGTNWCFEEITAVSPERAFLLESAPNPDTLLDLLVSAFAKALSRGDMRFGRERAEKEPDDFRAVVQFHVGEHLFDWIFNARNGYRAHFRADYRLGMDFNARIVDRLRQHLAANLPDNLPGRELSFRFNDIGEAQVAKSFVIQSLDPALSKVWLCARRIGVQGNPVETLPSGVVGPRIVLPDTRWAAPSNEDAAAWLDLKGAFLGNLGPYQAKDPVGRAKRLQIKGEA